MALASEYSDSPWLSLADQFAVQARMTPNAVALAGETESVTYAQLAEQANRLARHLIGRGVGPDVIVPVLLEPSVGMITAVLAVLTAGGAYMPIDAEAPPARINALIEDSGARLIVTSTSLASIPLPDHLEILRLDDPSTAAGWRTLSPQPITDGERLAPSEPATLCFIIYTSGTTGVPKGSGNTNAGLVNCLRWLTAQMALTGDERVLQQTACAFDMSLLEIFLPLTTGGSVVLVRPGGRRDMDHIVERIQAHAVSLAFFVPNMLMEFLRNEKASGCTSLRHLMAAGEALSAYVQAACHERLPGATLWNGYGPSETAVLVTLWRCRHGEETATPPIGRAAWNTGLHILDDQGQPAPDGTPGELYISGVHLARGYHRRPELTAEKFLPCPFGAPGERMYRTGDIVERRADGALMFHGRRDSQVKLNGVRIELGEIEAALAAIPSVARAAVIARELSGERRLIAYLVAAPGANPMSSAEIRRVLVGLLPHYMVPSRFIYVDAFPQTSSGKLLARALPDPAVQEAAPDEIGAGDDALEDLLAALFAELTGSRRIGRHQDFFELGGTSLTAMRLAGRLLRATGLALPMRLLIEHPTPARLAEALRRGTEEGEARAPGAGDLSEVFVFAGAGGYGLGLGALTLASAGVLELRVVDYPDWRTLGGSAAFDRMLQALARQVAGQARSGALRLAGYSLGGVVAYGVALELVRMGRTVAFVGLLDSDAPIAPGKPERLAGSRRRGLGTLARLRREGLLWRTLWGKTVMGAPIAILRLLAGLMRLTPADLRYSFDLSLNRNVMIGLTARWRRDRRRLDEKLEAPLVLFRICAAEDEGRAYRGWAFRSDTFESVIVDGDHLSMLGAGYSHGLLQKLVEAIRAVEARRP